MSLPFSPRLLGLSAGCWALLATGCAEMLDLGEFGGASAAGAGGVAGAGGGGGAGGAAGSGFGGGGGGTGGGGAAGGGAAPPCSLDAPFQAPTPVTALNSPAAERSVYLTADQLIVYFSSNRVVGLDALDQLWWASRNTVQDEFSALDTLETVNSLQDDFFPTLDGDGVTLVFASTRIGAPRSDLYIATRPNAAVAFDAAAHMAGVSSELRDFGPFVLPDLSALYLFSERHGSFDIYRAQGSNGAFATPIAVTEVNDPTATDGCPVPSADELTLYFYTMRDGGPPDIWKTQRSQTSVPFDEPVKVDELCTAHDDRPGWLSPDGCTLYFMSDRPGGLGGLDIWVAHRPP